MSGRRLVHSHELIEAAENDGARLSHQVAANGATRIRKAILEAGTCGVQQEPWGLYGIARDNDRPGTLEVFVTVFVEVMNTLYATVCAEANAGRHRIVADFGPTVKSIWHVRDERAGFCPHLATLNAKAAIDAVRPVSV